LRQNHCYYPVYSSLLIQIYKPTEWNPSIVMPQVDSAANQPLIVNTKRPLAQLAQAAGSP
jgi:hypothetical protein